MVNQYLKLKMALIILEEGETLVPYAEFKLEELGETPTDDKLAGFVLGYLTAVKAAGELMKDRGI